MKRIFLAIISAVILLIGSTNCEAQESDSTGNNNKKVKDLGAMTPEKALQYMKTAKDLLIVDVATVTHYHRQHFEGAVNIPIENISENEADALYRELPSGRPVILHCRRGIIVPGAYRRLKELRPDISEISYISGAPPFDAYNQWYNSNK